MYHAVASAGVSVLLQCVSYLLQLMTVIGNDSANKFWEWNLSPETKIKPDANQSVLTGFTFDFLLRSRFRFSMISSSNVLTLAGLGKGKGKCGFV